MKGLVVEATWAPKPEYKLNEREKREKMALNGAMVWKDPKLSIQEVPMPSVKNPQDVLIKIGACGVCGSDVHMMEHDEDGYILLPYNTKYPCIIGHEFAGEVMEVGKDVKNVKVGDLVAVEEINWCGVCNACRAGYWNLCENAEDLGFTTPGAFAEYVVARDPYCHTINGLIDVYDGDRDKAMEAGACVEPTGVAYETMFTRGGGFRPGSHVAVFGGGPIGQGATALAKAAGAGIIMGFEILPDRQEALKKMGADYVFSPEDLYKAGSSPHEEIMELTNGRGAGMLVEAAGRSDLLLGEMEDGLALGGTIANVSLYRGKAETTLLKYQSRAAKLVGGIGHCGNFPDVISLMESSRIDMAKSVTSRFKLDDAVKAIENTAKREDAKVLVKP